MMKLGCFIGMVNYDGIAFGFAEKSEGFADRDLVTTRKDSCGSRGYNL